jgi:predicted permease
MASVLDIALPLFAIIVLGAIARKKGLFADHATEILNRFVYWIALPPLLFLSMARQPIDQTINLPFIGAFLGSMLAIFGIGVVVSRVLLKNGAAPAYLHGFNASLCNTAYIGLPMFVIAYGPDRLAPAIIGSVLNASVLMGFVIGLLELARGRAHAAGASIAYVARALIRNPLVVAALAGILASLLGIRLPASLIALCTTLGAASGPCALFAIGLFLGGRPLASVLSGDKSEVASIVALKLVAQPLIAWILASYVFPMDSFWTSATVILAALPTGSLAFVVAQEYEVGLASTSTAILISTALSLVTLSILLATYAPLAGS